ncbi:hypothetical protein NQ314_000024 [Rhamnusium bicolor]|uniref:PiggyBac transposable element-derived protein domain-containing protein n=1 Tax=Rhamnusium bicolor TaxID=1586634 RepID=A0AAV8ZVU5_9CUCU|nr:hypothetical protein NQ314_000024 [Rhamnusium bicolor]
MFGHFETLLRFWRFADNSENISGDKLFKIRNLLNMLNEKFEKFKEPNKYIAVDETMVPFRGRLSFRQYIPGKPHKNGIKLFKVCDADVYTHRVEIYQDLSITKGENLTKPAVLRLCEAYLNKGRTIVTDNFYTRIELARELLYKNIHLIVT